MRSVSLQCGQRLCPGISLPALSSAVCHVVRIPARRQVSHPAHPFSLPLPGSMCVDGEPLHVTLHRSSSLFSRTVAILGYFSPFPGFRLSTPPQHVTRRLDLMKILPLVLTWSLESSQKLQQSGKQIKPRQVLKELQCWPKPRLKPGANPKSETNSHTQPAPWPQNP